MSGDGAAPICRPPVIAVRNALGGGGEVVGSAGRCIATQVVAVRRHVVGDRASASAVVQAAAATCRILIVDDDPLIRRQLESLYTAHGYVVDSASTVEEAIGKLTESEFALAVVDLKIGGSDGITLTGEIRERWPGVDVIMITGYGSIKGAVDAMRHGACDYIT